jgi:hypothetical protein
LSIDKVSQSIRLALVPKGWLSDNVVRLYDQEAKAMAKSEVCNRAKRHGQSVKEQVRDTLQDATKEEATPAHGLGTEISSLV